MPLASVEASGVGSSTSGVDEVEAPVSPVSPADPSTGSSPEDTEEETAEDTGEFVQGAALRVSAPRGRK